MVQEETHFPKSMLDFVYEISKDYLNFPEHVLNLICQYLGHKHMMFVPLNHNFFSLKNMPCTWITESIAFGITQELVDMYKDYHKADFFLTSNLPKKYWKKPVVFTDDLVTHDEFIASEYGQHLINTNLPYQAIINLVSDDIRLGVISIYHTAQEGNFTPQERVLLEEISPTCIKYPPLFYFSFQALSHAITSPQFAFSPSSTTIESITPSLIASKSLVIFSVIIEHNLSPFFTVSPTFTYHSTISPSSIVAPNLGIFTSYIAFPPLSIGYFLYLYCNIKFIFCELIQNLNMDEFFSNTFG